MLNRHDEVESLLRDAHGHYFPIFMNHKGETIVGPWAIGFSLGLSLRGEAWAPILLAAPKPVIAPIVAVNPQLAKLLIRLSSGVAQKKGDGPPPYLILSPAIARHHKTGTITVWPAARTQPTCKVVGSSRLQLKHAITRTVAERSDGA